MDEGFILMKSSPLHAITLGGRARELAGVPDDAVFFSYTYPLHKPRGARLDSVRGWERMKTDPFVLFLTVGSFVFFDFNFNIVSVWTKARSLRAKALPLSKCYALCLDGLPGSP